MRSLLQNTSTPHHRMLVFCFIRSFDPLVNWLVGFFGLVWFEIGSDHVGLDGLVMVTRFTSNSQRSACLCPPPPEIKGVLRLKVCTMAGHFKVLTPLSGFPY